MPEKSIDDKLGLIDKTNSKTHSYGLSGREYVALSAVYMISGWIIGTLFYFSGPESKAPNLLAALIAGGIAGVPVSLFYAALREFYIKR